MGEVEKTTILIDCRSDWTIITTDIELEDIDIVKESGEGEITIVHKVITIMTKKCFLKVKLTCDRRDIHSIVIKKGDFGYVQLQVDNKIILHDKKIPNNPSNPIVFDLSEAQKVKVQKEEPKVEPIDLSKVLGEKEWTMASETMEPIKPLKILLHAPLHPSYWVYLMETMPEHEWFIEPNENFEEGRTPKNHIEYTVVKKKSDIDYDVQIFCLGSHIQSFQKIVDEFPLPLVFLDYWKVNLPPLKVKYPLISCCHHISNKDYPNIEYIYVPPSRTLWNQDWEGDIRKVFIPAQRYLEPAYAHTYAAKLIPKLEKTDLELDIVLNRIRILPWKKWQDFFIHDRVLLDIADKRSSFVLEEAMTIGMPIISRNLFESPYIIRDKIDGFINWTEEELIEILHKFLEDYSFAKKWSFKSRERGREMLSVERTRGVFNRAFKNAIRLFNSTSNPLEKERSTR